MQASNLNKIIFSVLLFLLPIQALHSQSHSDNIRKADSLWAKNQLLQAEKLYEILLLHPKAQRAEIQLKLAYIAKSKNDWYKELNYLLSVQQEHDGPQISNRIAQIGEERGLSGYQITFWDKFRWLYFRYFGYLLFILSIPALYVAIVLIRKIYLNKPIYSGHVWAWVLYLASIVLLINFPQFFKRAITTKEKTYVRDFASAAAPVITSLNKGSIVVPLYHQDIWIACLVAGEFAYIKAEEMKEID